MAGKRDGNEDFGAGGDFRRKGASNNAGDGGGEETPAQKRANEYVRSLLAEKLAIDQGKLPIATKLLDQEVTKAQAEGKGPDRDQKFMDIYRDKPLKVTVKVLVPLKEHPKFNFVGKLLGPKGNSLKRLQEETMCRMAILGRGSMRDRDKEEEFRKSLEPKYAHLTDNLHVEISALGPPAEAYARIAFALTEVRKYLTPDPSDDISQGQLREMETIDDRPMPKGRGPPGSGPFRPPGMRGAPPPRPPMPMRTATRMPVAAPRGGPGGKANVMSILDRARAAMEEGYGGGYEEPYEPEPPYDDYSSGPARSGYGGGGNRFGGGGGGGSNYNSDYYGDNNDYSEGQRWKPYKTGGQGARPEQPRYRPTPYSRAGK